MFVYLRAGARRSIDRSIYQPVGANRWQVHIHNRPNKTTPTYKYKRIYLDPPGAELLAERGGKDLHGVLGGGVGAAERVPARDAGHGGDGDDAALALLVVKVCVGYVGYVGIVHPCMHVLLRRTSRTFLRSGRKALVAVTTPKKFTSMQKRKSCMVNQSISPERATPNIVDIQVYICGCVDPSVDRSIDRDHHVRILRTGVVDEREEPLRVLLRHAVRRRLHLLRLGHVQEEGAHSLVLSLLSGRWRKGHELFIYFIIILGGGAGR